MKFEITINPSFDTKDFIASALEDLALKVRGSAQDPATESAGYMGAYCGFATIKTEEASESALDKAAADQSDKDRRGDTQ